MSKVTIIYTSLGLLIVIFIGSTIFYWDSFEDLKMEYSNLELIVKDTRENLASTTAHAHLLSVELAKTLGELADEVERGDELSSDLRSEKRKNDDFEKQIEDITGTVGQLDKLAKTDPKLLQKYSKVFFLNEHYTPEGLAELQKKYLYTEEEPKFIHAKVKPHLVEMLEDAIDDEVEIWVVSAYRSFDEQSELKEQNLVTYGEGANTFSADQGYSEHQLGTTVDLITRGLGGDLQGFESTPAYEWLLKNAHKYGFVLSYPEANVYYVFEPWHWRFVGVDLATHLYKTEQNFYGLDQREIDDYLISLFD